MKTLYIVRHAKSSWDFSAIPDYDRPLLETGIIRTNKIIKYLKNQDTNPDLIVSSHALRAKETARIDSQWIVLSAREYQDYGGNLSWGH